MIAINYIRDNYSEHVQPYVWVPDYFYDLAKNLCPDVIIRPFSKAEKKFNPHWVGRRTTNPQHDALATHLVDHAFHVLVNKQVRTEFKNYPILDLKPIDISRFNLPDKYVIITTGFTAPIREMLPVVVNEISDYSLSKGYIPVFLGSHQAALGIEDTGIVGNFKTEIDYSKGLSLIDKTTLLEAGKIIAGAKTIVGLDNGLLHLAGCTEIPIVMGFTSVEPYLRLPYRHNELGWNVFSIVPDESIKCRFFQSNWTLFYDHDFKYCNNNYECVKNLTSDKYIRILEKIL